MHCEKARHISCHPDSQLCLFGTGQDEKPEKGNATRFGNVEGGKYGLGDRVDKALDATTDELQFKIGAIVCVTLPILLLIFGPRPPSEY